MNFFRIAFVIILLLLITPLMIHAQDASPITSGDSSPITAKNAAQIASLASLSGDVKEVSVSPDNSMIAVASQHGDEDYTISIFAMDTGEKISEMQGRMDFFYSLTWSPNSERIAVISRRTTGGGVEEWSVKTYTIELGRNFGFYILGNSDTWYSDDVFHPENPDNPAEIAWSPSSDMIAIAFSQRLDIDAADTKKTLISRMTSHIDSLQWTSDGKFVITRNQRDGSNQFDVTLWGIASAKS